MDPVRVHLFITHLPVFGLALGFLALIYGIMVKSKHANILALLIILVSAIGGIIALRTGEAAEHKVEEIAGVLESAIEEHEESAEATTPFFYGLLVLAAVAVYLEAKEKRYAKTASLIVLGVSVATFYLVIKTANLGGEIRHTEILPTEARE